MGSNSQRKKEEKKRRQAKRRLKALKRLQERQRSLAAASGTNARHLQRVMQQIPKGWPGEALADVAIFDGAAFESLPVELVAHVSAVRQALQDASESRRDDALKQLSTIPRGSPLSEWRLFVRGFVDWLADDFQAASEAWQRLDPERRPGRIATAMMTARRSDLQGVSLAELAELADASGRSGDGTDTDWLSRCDEQLLYHAKLLRRTYFERAAIRIAETGVEIPDESKELTLGPDKIRWLQRFVSEYEATEPDLVAALSQCALGRAFTQKYSDLFDLAAQAFKGPRHDRKNLLLTFFYFSRFAESDAGPRAERALEQYLKKLPDNSELSEPLQRAIASQIHLNEATSLMHDRRSDQFNFMFGPDEDPQVIRNHLRAAVKAYSANRGIYQKHVEWINSKLDDDRLEKPKRERWEKELAEVMQSWSKALPEDSEPRLWLVDYLLENERTNDAKPHIEWLANSRQDDPRVREAPWKWQVLEAMRLCRRKAWQSEVPERLEQADQLWPAWLSRQWLAYLKAAWTLRSGLSDYFEMQRQQICQETGLVRDSIADACMMLGAAQRMQVPAADLKHLRDPVDRAVKDLGPIPLDELLSVSNFFWDLQRTQLIYPAYRMHGGKIGRELLTRLSANPEWWRDRLNDPKIQSAILWCSEHRFWTDGYQLRLPSWISVAEIQRHPILAAAKVNAFLKLRYHLGAEDYRQFGPLLREASQTERDPYYRHWFQLLADGLDEVLATKGRRPTGSGPGFDFFRAAFGSLDLDLGNDDDEDDDEDDDMLDDLDLGFDPDCDCPECQAAKRKYKTGW